MILTELSPGDVVVGRPLRCSVFDHDRKLLLAQGKIVTQALYDKLMRLGAYKLTLDLGAAPAESAPANLGVVEPLVLETSALSQADSDSNSDAAAPAPGLESAHDNAETGTRTLASVATPHPETSTGAVTSKGTISRTARQVVDPKQLFSQWVDFMHLTDAISGQTIGYRLSLLGVIGDTSLMVTSATLEQDWDAMMIGRRFNATVFNGRQIFVFDTAIMHRFDEPFRYLYLSMPGKVAERPARRTLRANVSIEAALVQEVGHRRESTAAIIVDLSTQSAGLVTPNLRLRVGTGVALVFTLPLPAGEKVLIRVGAVVRRQSVDTGSAVANYGLEFIDVPAAARTRLNEFVAQAAAVEDELP